MLDITKDDGHNEPTIHRFRDWAHARAVLVDGRSNLLRYQNRSLTSEQFDRLLEDGECEDNGADVWRVYTGYHILVHE